MVRDGIGGYVCEQQNAIAQPATVTASSMQAGQHAAPWQDTKHPRLLPTWLTWQDDEVVQQSQHGDEVWDEIQRALGVGNGQEGEQAGQQAHARVLQCRQQAEGSRQQAEQQARGSRWPCAVQFGCMYVHTNTVCVSRHRTPNKIRCNRGENESPMRLPCVTSATCKLLPRQRHRAQLRWRTPFGWAPT